MLRHNDRASDENLPITARVFAELYADNFLQVKAFLTRKGCVVSSLEDLAQEAFLRAWKGRDAFVGKSSIRTWLFAIARNVSLEAYKNTRAKPLDEESPVEGRELPIMYSDEVHAIRVAVSQLPSKERMAIALVYLEGMRPVEAARKLNCNHDVIYQRMAKGRKRLRQLLEGNRNGLKKFDPRKTL